MARPRTSTKKPKPTTAIGYVRVSTDSQADRGVSLAAQREKLRQYAALYDLTLVEIVSETASARSLDRPHLRRALSSLKKGKADALLIAKLDRLTRSAADLGTLLSEHFHEKGAALLSVEDHLDTSTASGRLSMNVLISVSQWEREVIGERTKAALVHLRSQGRATGGAAPFGYAKEEGRLVEVPAEQRIITRARALHADGLNQGAIAEALGREGYRSRSGGRFFQAQVGRWIVDRGFTPSRPVAASPVEPQPDPQTAASTGRRAKPRPEARR